jgi:signal transduction histidine kinase
VVLALGLAFHRLQAVNRQLVERSASLLRANEELALAAKTSAVGAVTSHLIHGLSSPLTGLQNLVAQRSGADRATSDTDWQHAIALTQQMQTLIGEIVRVLREHQGGQQYELTLAELVGILADRMTPLAQAAQVRFHREESDAAILTNREANLVLLILENLIRNAIEATPASGVVKLTATADSTGIQFEVHDAGPGLPAAVQEHLFQPCRSTKPQGNGIGLAICQQLAHHLGARVELSRSSAQGCVFTLRLPRPPTTANR